LEVDANATMTAFDSVRASDLSLCASDALVETMPGGQAFDSPAIKVMKIARRSVSTAAPITLRVPRWVFNRTIFDRLNMAQRLSLFPIVLSSNGSAQTLMQINCNSGN
jgi:hypothetical protein